MKVYARLPEDRQVEGELAVVEDGIVVLGPARCRGEADNAGAAAHDNPDEDPTRSHGDHPWGLYRIMAVVRDKPPARSYGPAFIVLDPVSGQAKEAKDQGRTGIGIHGGDPGQGGSLRPTFGCLRIENDIAEALANLLEPELEANTIVFYECGPNPLPIGGGT